jgi:dipeptidyl aminopeptidase/acylaminoacyl peptidase
MAQVLAAVGVLAGVLTAQAAFAASTQDWIYYVSYPGGKNCEVSEIWRVHPDGSSPQAVLPPAIDDFSYEVLTSDDTEGVFAVSPTGEYIVRVIKVDEGELAPGLPAEKTHLFVYDLATGTVRQLTSGATFDEWPSVSPDGQTVAYISSAYHAVKGSDGTYHVGPGNPSLYTIPIVGGTPRRVPTKLDAGGSELSWMSNQSLIYDTEAINLETGRETPFVHQGRAYFFDTLSSTWTPLGLLYVGNYNLFDPSYGGTRAGRPPSGLYLASKRVKLKGRLLRRYHYQVSSPVPNGLFSIQLLRGSQTVVGQYENHLVSGPLTGGALTTLQVPRGSATRPEVASGPETLAPGLLTAPPIGNVPGCGA